MKNPIFEVHTKDKVVLHGLFLEAAKSKSVIIFIHGTASNFYENYFIYHIADSMSKIRVSLLSVNNRGADVLQAYPSKGAAAEFFEDCVSDIDAWINFASSKGYRKIILMGHSLGSEKIVYYMNKGTLRKKVNGIVLLGFADSFGTQQDFVKGKNYLMEEAERLSMSGKGNVFLTSEWFSHAGVLPKNADSYINFFREGSDLSKSLPLRKGKELGFYRNISVPILGVIGDVEDGKGHEYTVIPVKQATYLLEKENALAECHQIEKCNHDFEGREAELAKIIRKWIVKILKL